MQRVRFGDLRRISIPEPQADEPDLITALRMTCETAHPDRMRVTVPDEMAEMIPNRKPKPAEKPAAKIAEELEDEPHPKL